MTRRLRRLLPLLDLRLRRRRPLRLGRRAAHQPGELRLLHVGARLAELGAQRVDFGAQPLQLALAFGRLEGADPLEELVEVVGVRAADAAEQLAAVGAADEDLAHEFGEDLVPGGEGVDRRRPRRLEEELERAPQVEDLRPVGRPRAREDAELALGELDARLPRRLQVEDVVLLGDLRRRRRRRHVGDERGAVAAGGCRPRRRRGAVDELEALDEAASRRAGDLEGEDGASSARRSRRTADCSVRYASCDQCSFGTIRPRWIAKCLRAAGDRLGSDAEARWRAAARGRRVAFGVLRSSALLPRRAAILRSQPASSSSPLRRSSEKVGRGQHVTRISSSQRTPSPQQEPTFGRSRAPHFSCLHTNALPGIARTAPLPSSAAAAFRLGSLFFIAEHNFHRLTPPHLEPLLRTLSRPTQSRREHAASATRRSSARRQPAPRGACAPCRRSSSNLLVAAGIFAAAGAGCDDQRPCDVDRRARRSDGFAAAQTVLGLAHAHRAWSQRRMNISIPRARRRPPARRRRRPRRRPSRRRRRRPRSRTGRARRRGRRRVRVRRRVRRRVRVRRRARRRGGLA